MSTNKTCPISSSISCLISAAILIHAETRHLQFASRTEAKASFGEVAGRPLRRPASFTIEMSDLLAGAFGCLLCLGHLCRHLCFYGVKVETRAFLHRRILKEGLEFLAHHLLDENKTPEFILEP